MHALSVHGLSKRYRNGVHALQGIDLQVAEGDFFALLGPNGAGKSTLISICTSLVTKTAGSVQVFGHDYAQTLALWRERFEAAWPDIAKLGFDEKFRRRWTYYLSYCEAGFREGSIDVGIYRFRRPG